MKTTAVCLLAFIGYSCAFAINSTVRVDWSRVRDHEQLRGVAKRGLGIIGGNEVAPHSAPYQVAIITSDTGICGGALISTTVIVTAAHCVNGAMGVNVVLGAHAIREAESSQVLELSENVIVHPDYVYSQTDLENDIALILLPSPVTINEFVKTVALPSADDTADLTGTKAFLTGWGTTSTDPSAQIPQGLQGATLDIISNEQCKPFFEPDSIVSDNVLCTSGEGNVGACTGDSGSPLVENGVLVGVVSFGADGCVAGYPTGFTRISKYTEWIRQQAGASL